MSQTIRTFSFAEPDYSLALALRYKTLREPLKLHFTPEELKKDEADLHFGLFDGNEILACLTLTLCENNSAKMRQVAVRENAQCKGFGKKLCEYAEIFCVEKNLEFIFFGTFFNNSYRHTLFKNLYICKKLLNCYLVINY